MFIDRIVAIVCVIIQFIWIIWLIWIRIKRKYSQTAYAPTIEQASKLATHWTTLPTFSIGRWRRKLDPLISDSPAIEKKNDGPQNFGDANKGSHFNDKAHPDMKEEEAAAENLIKHYSKLPNTTIRRKNLFLLQKYRVLLFLEILHSFFWMMIFGVEVVQPRINFLFDLQNYQKVLIFPHFFVVGFAILFNTMVCDGVAFYMTRHSLSRRVLHVSRMFAFIWAVINVFTSIVFGVVGHSSYMHISSAAAKLIPWWNPFVIRFIFMFVFNFMLLVVRLLSPIRATNGRNAWLILVITNILISVLALTSNIIPQHIIFERRMDGLIKYIGILTGIMFYPPILYFALLKDSQYWRESWIGALSNISASETPLLENAGNNIFNVVIDFNALEFKQLVGSGSFSKVYRGSLWSNVKLPVAIKVLHVHYITKEFIETFLEEVSIFVKFNHPNVVLFVGACISPPELIIIMELCKPKSLGDLIKDHSLGMWKKMEKLRKRLWKERSRGTFSALKVNQDFTSYNDINTMPRTKQRSISDSELSTPINIDPKESYPAPVLSLPNNFDKNVRTNESSLQTSTNLSSKLATSIQERKSTSARPSLHIRSPQTISRLNQSNPFNSKNYSKLFPIKRAVNMGLVIAKALEYIHSFDVLHRDLKSSNIIFDKFDRPKICDFGLSRDIKKVNATNSFAGTIAYMAPEIMAAKKATKKSDVFSFGILFWEILTGRISWTKYHFLTADWNLSKRIPRPTPVSFGQIIERVRKKERPKIHQADNIHPVLAVMMKHCWEHDPNLRPSFSKIVELLEAFHDSSHFKGFEIHAKCFGDSEVSKWLRN